MLAGILIVGVVALAVVLLVAGPVARLGRVPEPEDPALAGRREIDEELERSLAAIREIEMDHRAGNLSDEDFAALERAERARAVELMRRVEIAGKEFVAIGSNAAVQP